MKKIKLDDVIDALEFVNSGMDCNVYYDDKTNKFIYIGDYSDMTSAEREDVYDNCIELPTKYYIDEYKMMEEFIDTIEDVNIYNNLEIAISGKGAFRRFKDTCNRHGIESTWYKFRDEKYKEIAIEWCKKNNINFE